MAIELGQGTGPLRGVKVVEIAGIGPGPHACMILADLGRRTAARAELATALRINPHFSARHAPIARARLVSLGRGR